MEDLSNLRVEFAKAALTGILSGPDADLSRSSQVAAALDIAEGMLTEHRARTEKRIAEMDFGIPHRVNRKARARGFAGEYAELALLKAAEKMLAILDHPTQSVSFLDADELREAIRLVKGAEQ